MQIYETPTLPHSHSAQHPLIASHLIRTASHPAHPKHMAGLIGMQKSIHPHTSSVLEGCLDGWMDEGGQLVVTLRRQTQKGNELSQRNKHNNSFHAHTHIVQLLLRLRLRHISSHLGSCKSGLRAICIIMRRGRARGRLPKYPNNLSRDTKTTQKQKRKTNFRRSRTWYTLVVKWHLKL